MENEFPHFFLHKLAKTKRSLRNNVYLFLTPEKRSKTKVYLKGTINLMNTKRTLILKRNNPKRSPRKECDGKMIDFEWSGKEGK